MPNLTRCRHDDAHRAVLECVACGADFPCCLTCAAGQTLCPDCARVQLCGHLYADVIDEDAGAPWCARCPGSGPRQVLDDGSAVHPGYREHTAPSLQADVPGYHYERGRAHPVYVLRALAPGQEG